MAGAARRRPTHLTNALTSLEGGAGVVLTPSGLSAITTALFSVLKAGDHLLVTDSAYFPTRHFCDTALAKLGVEVTYYDPRIGGAIEKLFKPNTRALFLESPGSLSFEMQDVPAIVQAAHRHGAADVDGQHLGNAALFQAARIRRRSRRSPPAPNISAATPT